MPSGKCIDYRIGDQLRRLRLSHGYPEDFIANLLELSAEEYGQIERGDTRISLTSLHILSRFFNLNITDFLEGANACLPTPQSPGQHMDPAGDEDLMQLKRYLSMK